MGGNIYTSQTQLDHTQANTKPNRLTQTRKYNEIPDPTKHNHQQPPHNLIQAKHLKARPNQILAASNPTHSKSTHR